MVAESSAKYWCVSRQKLVSPHSHLEDTSIPISWSQSQRVLLRNCFEPNLQQIIKLRFQFSTIIWVWSKNIGKIGLKPRAKLPIPEFYQAYEKLFEVKYDENTLLSQAEYAIIDTEATGLDLDTDEIISIGGCDFSKPKHWYKPIHQLLHQR